MADHLDLREGGRKIKVCHYWEVPSLVIKGNEQSRRGWRISYQKNIFVFLGISLGEIHPHRIGAGYIKMGIQIERNLQH